MKQRPVDVLFEHSADDRARVTVAVSCFNYGKEGIEALDSLLAQTEDVIDVVVVDDCSTNDSADLLMRWFGEHGCNEKFGRVSMVRHVQNERLAQSRNTAIALTRTPYFFVLDADNQLYPRALKVLREAIENSGYAMAYSLIERFGAEHGIVNKSLWIPERFRYGNYIDAMALIRTDVLRELDGYHCPLGDNFQGWEDYDLWCCFVDRGLRGCHVPQILCRYRVHHASMLRTSTNPFVQDRVHKIREDFESRHKGPFFFGS